MKDLYVLFTLFTCFTTAISDLDWNAVNAKYESIITRWRGKIQRALSANEGDVNQRLKSAQQMLTTFIDTEIYSKLSELENRINDDFKPIQAGLLQENRLKLDDGQRKSPGPRGRSSKRHISNLRKRYMTDF